MTDTRPNNCRFRLADEGKPHPRSSCDACRLTITSGLGKACQRGRIEPTLAHELTDRIVRGITVHAFENDASAAAAIETQREPIQKMLAKYLPADPLAGATYETLTRDPQVAMEFANGEHGIVGDVRRFIDLWLNGTWSELTNEFPQFEGFVRSKVPPRYYFNFRTRDGVHGEFVEVDRAMFETFASGDVLLESPKYRQQSELFKLNGRGTSPDGTGEYLQFEPVSARIVARIEPDGKLHFPS